MNEYIQLLEELKRLQYVESNEYFQSKIRFLNDKINNKSFDIIILSKKTKQIFNRLLGNNFVINPFNNLKQDFNINDFPLLLIPSSEEKVLYNYFCENKLTNGEIIPVGAVIDSIEIYFNSNNTMGKIKDSICICNFDNIQRLNGNFLKFDLAVINYNIINYAASNIQCGLKKLKKICSSPNLYVSGINDYLDTNNTLNYVINNFKDIFPQGVINSEDDDYLTEYGINFEDVFLNLIEHSKKNYSFKVFKNNIRLLINDLLNEISKDLNIKKLDIFKNIEDVKIEIEKIQIKRQKLVRNKDEFIEKKRKEKDLFLIEIKRDILDFYQSEAIEFVRKKMEEYKRKEIQGKINLLLKDKEKDFIDGVNLKLENYYKNFSNDQSDFLNQELNKINELVNNYYNEFKYNEGNILGATLGGTLGGGGYLTLALAYGGNTWNFFQAALGALNLHKGAAAAKVIYGAVGGGTGVGAIIFIAGTTAFLVSKKIYTELTWKDKMLDVIKESVRNNITYYIETFEKQVNKNFEAIESNVNSILAYNLDAFEEHLKISLKQKEMAVNEAKEGIEINQIKMELDIINKNRELIDGY